MTTGASWREAPYALTVLRAPEGIADVRALRLEEATAAFQARGYERTQTADLSLDPGEHTTRPVQVPPGRCVAIAAAGDADVEDLDLFLRTADGQLVASESGPAPWAAVSRCVDAGDAPESLELEVVMYRGGGDVTLARLEGAP